MSPRGRLPRGGVIVPLFLMVLTTVYLAEAVGIRSQFGGEGGIGPRTIPILAAILMYVSLLVVLVQELRGEGGEASDGGLIRPALVVLATGVYIFIFRPLGYWPATALYVAALFFVFQFETKRPLWFTLYVALVTIAFYGLFAGVFGVRLPPVLGTFG